MANRTYSLTEIVGTSPDSVDAAIRNGLQRAAKTVRHLDWFEVTDIRGHVREDAVHHFQAGQAAVADFRMLQALRDDTDHFTTGGQGRIGDDTHQTHRAAAIDQADALLGEGAAEGHRRRMA